MDWYKRQKKAGARLELTWFEARNCWKKYKDGRVYYFKHPNSKSGYESALQDWFAKLRELDSERPLAKEYLHHLNLLQNCVRWYEQFGVPDLEDDIWVHLNRFLDKLKRAQEEETLVPLFDLVDGVVVTENGIDRSGNAFINSFAFDEFDHVGKFGTLDWELPNLWADRVRFVERNAAPKPKRPQTVGYWADALIQFKEAQAAGDERSPNTLKDLREKLSRFRTFIADETHVSNLSADTLHEYYVHLLKLSMAGSSKQGYFDAARRFIRWTWRQDASALEALPKNIDDGELSFNTTIDSTGRQRSAGSLVWTPKEFKAVTKVVNKRWQCWLYLMLNCGFTQTDLNELRHDELDLKQGRIIRRRTKTKRNPNPPLVNYKLWKKTLSLLKANISNHSEFALLTARGSRLTPKKVETLADGTLKSTTYDNVSRNWQEVRADHEVCKGKVLKGLRKSGTTTIKGNVHFGWLDSLYLGQSNTIADKHYNAHDGRVYKPLDEAIAYIGEVFGIK